MSYYDKYGGDPATATIYAPKGGGSGSVVSTVPISSGGQAPYQKPNFKTLFENSAMFDPTNHRQYFVVLPNFDSDGTVQKPYNPKVFDKKEIELITLTNNDKEYITLSTKTIAYLKEQDKLFVQASIFHDQYSKWAYGQLHKYDSVYNSWNAYATNYFSSHYSNHLNYYNQVQIEFKEFVGAFGESLLELNNPFVYSYDDNGIEKYAPVSLGNFSPYDVQEMIDNNFGDVTGDDFIPIANEIKYDNKEPTNCCMKYCMYKDYYRTQKTVEETNTDGTVTKTVVDVPYAESQEKIADTTEFEKWVNSDEYNPYVPSLPATSMTIDSFRNTYENLNSLVNSPLGYAFDKLIPYFKDALEDLKNEYPSLVRADVSRNGDTLNLDLDFDIRN